MLSSIIWTPLVFGLIGLLVPKRFAAWVAALGAVITLGLAIGVLAGFDPDGGMQYITDVSWIPGLGVDYSLGIDGVSIFLVLLTTIAWIPAICFSAIRGTDRPALYYLMLLAGETSTLGAFLAQDLLLFVLFFDLMIVPFYFLFGIWGRDRGGEEDPERSPGNGPVSVQSATLKMIVFTLIGSLLMLVGAIAAAVIAADGGELTFSIQTIVARGLPEGSQNWIFWFFAAAFLVKMPAFPLHGWMPDSYRAAPLPALAVFSAVLSKVGAYGFLRVVLPMMPDASDLFQSTMLVLAICSILYGSAMAFTKTDLRLVLGFSSVAQLGFITAGIFAFDSTGAEGAVLQMVNHGLVVVPAFLIVAMISERTGSEELGPMGGLAKKAPVFAVIFLIVSMATLAIPASANFIGEFYILNGLFQVDAAWAIVASVGVALAAFYALRMYQLTMHNPLPDGSDSREISLRDALVLVPMVGIVVVLAFCPQLIIHGSEQAVDSSIAIVREVAK
ncbi:MAG: NADH-quinone oxidoreductase subunit M [Solirubrobacterales bacterium]|nr:NADH-quinone oxidoreductase subunit M [Solirubrobacterales bacterium]MCB8914518.1 NADH-quinone oxidoreductase subunit M [Thermoleophilales bacterium]